MTDADARAKRPDDAGILITWKESPLAVKALLAGIFVNQLGSFIRVFLVLFLTARGFSTVQAGIALGASSAGAVVGVLIGGALTDRLGPRRTILVSLSSTAVLTLSIFYVRYYPALLVVVAVVGAVGWAYGPAANALLSRLTPKQRQVMIFAIVRLCHNLGTTVAPLIGAALIAVSYGLLFWAEAAAIAGYALIVAIALPRRSTVPAPEQPTTAPDRAGYGPVLADRRYLLFLLAALINALVYVQYVSTLPVAIKAAGLGTTFFGAILSLNGFIVITCELLVTKVTQRLPARAVVMVGFVLLGSGMAIYALPLGAAVFVVGTLVWTLAEIVAGPTIFAYPAIVSPEHLRGRYLGALTAVFGIGSATGAVVGLAVWSQVGRAVWVWCGIACLLGVSAVWLGMRPLAAAPTVAPPAGVDADEAAEPAQVASDVSPTGTARELTDR